jgi:GNAT superfamily N-acetyltransferase
MAEVLAASFEQDPAFVHLLPLDVPRRRQRLERFFAMELPRSLAEGGAWTTTDGAGAAVWYPPGRWKPSAWQTLRQVPGILLALGRHARLGSQIVATLQDHHPSRTHWYLLYVGVDLDRQGQGIGSSLLQPVLALCDQQGLPAYLEATNERNRRLYLRHGFVDQQALPLPAGGPPLRPMWREPDLRCGP